MADQPPSSGIPSEASSGDHMQTDADGGERVQQVIAKAEKWLNDYQQALSEPRARRTLARTEQLIIDLLTILRHLQKQGETLPVQRELRDRHEALLSMHDGDDAETRFKLHLAMGLIHDYRLATSHQQTEIARLEAALAEMRTYARHKPECARSRGRQFYGVWLCEGESCTCGLDALAAEPEKTP